MVAIRPACPAADRATRHPADDDLGFTQTDFKSEQISNASALIQKWVGPSDRSSAIREIVGIARRRPRRFRRCNQPPWRQAYPPDSAASAVVCDPTPSLPEWLHIDCRRRARLPLRHIIHNRSRPRRRNRDGRPSDLRAFVAEADQESLAPGEMRGTKIAGGGVARRPFTAMRSAPHGGEVGASTATTEWPALQRDQSEGHFGVSQKPQWPTQPA